MLEAAKKVREKAYAPYSHFHVGCCVKTDKNNLYSGCNIENASYSLVLCAESSAIAQMVSAGEKHIVEVTIISSGDEICTPCGACRQRLVEFGSPETVITMYNNQDKKLISTLKELLPYSFSALHLEKKQHE